MAASEVEGLVVGVENVAEVAAKEVAWEWERELAGVGRRKMVFVVAGGQSMEWRRRREWWWWYTELKVLVAILGSNIFLEKLWMLL